MKENASLASLDLFYMIDELSSVEGAIAEKAYSKGDAVSLALHIPSKGKVFLNFSFPGFVYLSSNKPSFSSLTSFASSLRKRLSQSRLKGVSQHNFDRVLIFEFEAKWGKFFLVAELFSKGNLILCDSDMVIIMPLKFQSWSSRKIRPHNSYAPPPASVNPLTLSEEEFIGIAASSEKSIAGVLASVLGLGGVYAEEVLYRAGFPKSSEERNRLDEKKGKESLLRIYSSLKSLFSLEKKPTAYFKDSSLFKIAPFPVLSLGSLESRRFESMSAAINEFAFLEDNEDKEEGRLSRVLSDQLRMLEEYRLKRDDARLKAEMVYSHYAEIDELLNLLRNNRSLLQGENSIAEKVKKKFPFVREINGKTGRVVVTFTHNSKNSS